MGKLEDLYKRRSELWDQQKKLNSEIKEAELEDIHKRYGVTVGTVVVDGKGRKYSVCEIEPKSFGGPYLKGNPMTSKGVFGKAIRNLWGWKLDDTSND